MNYLNINFNPPKNEQISQRFMQLDQSDISFFNSLNLNKNIENNERLIKNPFTEVDIQLKNDFPKVKEIMFPQSYQTTKTHKLKQNFKIINSFDDTFIIQRKEKKKPKFFNVVTTGSEGSCQSKFIGYFLKKCFGRNIVFNKEKQITEITQSFTS